MRGYRQFTEEDVQKIARLHAQGFRKTDIVLSTQLPLHVVYYIMDKRLLIPKPKRKKRVIISRERKLDDQTINRIIVLTNFGYHLKEIAEDQQLPEPLVKSVIEKAIEKKLIKKC
jgi:hypothetical protein